VALGARQLLEVSPNLSLGTVLAVEPLAGRALPNVANRIRKIKGYALRVEGLAYSRDDGLAGFKPC